MTPDEKETLAAAVAEVGALPMPVGPGPLRTLDVVEEELTGVSLSLWEEEQTTARLRLALASAQRGRRELRARVAELESLVAEAPASYALMERAAESANRLTRFFAPVASLREDEAAEDPCRPCGCPKRFNRHAEGCTAQAPRRDACQSCGSLPETWCPDCAVCKAGCFDGFVDNSCSHSNASWGGGS
ncbi:hypothetical protein [Streptomyces sp. NPDC060001]|uniref:hypothetical protein n=1 Tax=Streptomyces sp. NPDC060001 TaxID=3347032 RepID=UPI00369CE119